MQQPASDASEFRASIYFKMDPAWPTAQNVADCSCADSANSDEGDHWIDATACAGPGWCMKGEWARWSDGVRFLKARAPIGLSFDRLGVADLGAGLHVVACSPKLMYPTDPALFCVLELQKDIGLLRVSRLVPVPSSEHAPPPALADWSSHRHPGVGLVGGRVEDDLLVAFADSLARVSLAEWAPKPPVVCTWGTDYCSDGVARGTRLLTRDDNTFSIEVVCQPVDHMTLGPPRPYCVTCRLPGDEGVRGTTREATSLESGQCAE